MSMKGWIAVDLDGTLARYDSGQPIEHIGPPVHEMRNRVLMWLANGDDVRIFTARVAIVEGLHSEDGEADAAFALGQRLLIEAWCEEHLGQILPVTAVKDFQMIALYDDRCQPVEMNTGKLLLNPEGMK